jgi:hypothetical protein
MALGLGTEYPLISSNLGAGYGVFGTADPYNSALPNNGALNPPGSVYFIPAPSEGSSTLATAAGYAAGLWCKYVLYKSTSNPAMVSGPAPVYYTSNTFSTVSGTFAEGVIASKSNSAAGWLLVNTGSVTGVGVGSAITATILNNGGNGSYVFVGLQGFIPSAYLAAGSVGQRVYGSGDFSTTGVTIDTSAYSNFNFIGSILAAPASNIANVLAYSPAIF